MSRRIVILFLSVVCLIGAVSGSFSQTSKGPYVSREIPDATTGTSDEAKWWQELKTAAEAVKESHGDKKKIATFRELLQTGEEKSYQPPVPDSKPFILYKAQPGYTQQARQRRINGHVVLRVELRPDGFIGEVTILSGLDYGLNERALDVTRAMVFLPAVKDRKFASHMVNVENNFMIF
jgi:TonB family protein